MNLLFVTFTEIELLLALLLFYIIYDIVAEVFLVIIQSFVLILERRRMLDQYGTVSVAMVVLC